MSDYWSDEHIQELIVKAGKRLDVVMNDDRIRHVGSDPVFLATHDAMNNLASVLALLDERGIATDRRRDRDAYLS